MRVGFFLDTYLPMFSGIWYHRVKMPSEALGTRGHFIQQFAIGKERPKKELIDSIDVIVFGRTYPVGFDPVADMLEFKKAGKRIIYDIDDDIWTVAEHNSAFLVSNANKDQYESMIKLADAIITPSATLAKKIKKHFKKPVFICPNAINYEDYKERPHQMDKLIIGYMGASSHWADLNVIVEALEALNQKYDFLFSIYGLTSAPLEADVYTAGVIVDSHTQPEKEPHLKELLKFWDKLKTLKTHHTPFMPPEIHPRVLSRLDFDIGIAPLEDTEFNRGKSNIKFYEYAAVGAVTVTSDVLPYSEEVTYRAKNTFKDWYNKIEKLIIDEPFRKKLLKEQQDYVKKNRSIETVALDWELALQAQTKNSPGVLNQIKKIFK